MGLFSRYVRTIRIRKVLPWLEGDVLDMGCGEATILEFAGDSIASYCGVEHTEESLRSLRQRYPQHTFLCADLDQDSITTDRRFDTILMVAVVEHIYNQKHLFDEVLAKLSDRGRIVITSPTPLGDKVHRIAAGLGLLARSAVDHHPIIFNKARFRVFARKFGLRIEKYRTFECGCNQIVVLCRDDSRQSR